MSVLLRVSLAVLVATTAVDAKPTKAALRKASRSFTLGDRAYRLGNYQTAIQKFEAAYALSEDPLVLINIAQSLRKQSEIAGEPGMLTRARDLYRTFLREAPNSPECANVEKVLKEVEKKIAEREVAAGRDDSVAAAKLLAEQQQYDDALAELEKAERRPNNSTAELVDIHKLRGILLAKAGREADASQAFRSLLALDPGYGLPDNIETPVMRAFAPARSWWTGKQPPRLSVSVPSRAEESKPFPVRAEVPSDPLKMVSRVEVLVRSEGQKEFARYQGTLVPAKAVTAPGVDIIVIAVDPYGGTICTEGTVERPLRVKVGVDRTPVASASTEASVDISIEPQLRATPWYKKPLVWGAVGVAVAGGVTAAILLSRDDGGSDACSNCESSTVVPE